MKFADKKKLLREVVPPGHSSPREQCESHRISALMIRHYADVVYCSSRVLAAVDITTAKLVLVLQLR